MKRGMVLLFAVLFALFAGACGRREASESESSSKPAEGTSSETLVPETFETVPESTGIPGDEPGGGAREMPGHTVPGQPIVTDSLSYCVLTADGAVFMGHDELVPYAPASITKVLTLLVVCESVSLDEVVTVREEDLKYGIAVMSSGVYPSLKPEEKLTVRDLLYALIMPSTNAAGNVLATHVSGTVEAFAAKMNEKVAALGLSHSRFMNPHGLDEPGHYTCAYDMAVILKAAMENPLAEAVLSDSGYVIPATEYAVERAIAPGHALMNSSMYTEGVIGGKPGFTLNAQGTLLTAVERGGKRFYIATMHSDESLHYKDTQNLIEAAYAYEKGETPEIPALLHNMTVTKENADGVEITWDADNGPAQYRIVYWRVADGTGSAVFSDILEADGAVKTVLPLSKKGGYIVQFILIREDGTEEYSARRLLFTGERKPVGIVDFEGNSYYINDRGFLMTGGVETPDGCYYTTESGVILKDCQANGRFHAGPDGKIVTGWFTYHYDQYYAGADGRIVEDDCIVDGVLRHFTDYGALIREEE